MRLVLWTTMCAILTLGVACAAVNKHKGAISGAAKKTAKDEAGKAQKTAEEMKEQGLRNAFSSALDSHVQNYGQLKSKLDRYEGSYQAFVKAAKKKVKKTSKWKTMTKEHDALMPDIEALGPQHDELLAWAETKKESPTEADLQKLGSDQAELTQAQGQYVTKYGEWHSTMEALKSKYKMKVVLEKVETETVEAGEAAQGAADDAAQGAADEVQEATE